MAAAATEPEHSLSGLRVLVVEDEFFPAQLLQDFLNCCGCEVLGPVPTVRAALRLLEQDWPDVAFLDVNLRGESAAPIAERLRHQGVPVVLVTGYEASSLLDDELHQHAFVPKPASQADLARALIAVLPRRRCASPNRISN